MKYLCLFLSFCCMFSCSAETYKATEIYAQTIKNVFEYKGEQIALTTYRTIGKESVEERRIDPELILGVQEEFSYRDNNLFMGFLHDLERQTSVYGVYMFPKNSKIPELMVVGGYLGFTVSNKGNVYAVVNPSFDTGEPTASLHSFEVDSNQEIYTRELFNLENSVIADIVIRDEKIIVSGYKLDEPFALVAVLGEKSEVVLTNLSKIK